MPDPITPQNFREVPQHRAQPQSSGVTAAGVVNFAAKLGGMALGATPYGALGGVAGGLLGGNGALGGIGSQLGDQQAQMFEMLQIQNQMQLLNQQFTTLSNVSKTEHETRMAAVRNIRA